jgi:hypothetical protein
MNQYKVVVDAQSFCCCLKRNFWKTLQKSGHDGMEGGLEG